jgi:histone demethylase JARID1
MRESSALPAKGRKSSRQSDDSQQSPPATQMPSDFSGRQASAFYSCLAIPVEGVTPIQDQDDNPKSSSSQPSNAPKRAPRKSKTDALAAMQMQATSSDDKSQSSYQATGVRTFDDPGPPITVSPVLDMNSVKTTSPHNLPPRKYPRPFGLEDCPGYYPTVEEFKDPLGYIRSVSDHARNYGICKIVPPDSWKMPFTTDTEVSFVATFSRHAHRLPYFPTHRHSVSRQGCSASTLSKLRREQRSTFSNSCTNSTNSRATPASPSRR